jgi:hypothetical protein
MEKQIKIILPSNYILEHTADSFTAAPIIPVQIDDELPTYEHPSPPANTRNISQPEPESQPDGRIYGLFNSYQKQRRAANLGLRGLLTLLSIILILIYIFNSKNDGALLVIGTFSLIWSFIFFFKVHITLSHLFS